MVFGKRLKELRNEHKLTQQEFSNTLHINRSTIAGYESENKQPDYDTLQKFADFFNVSVDYILGRVDIRSITPVEDAGKEDLSDLRRIERARNNMPLKDKEKMMRILEASFEDYFDEDED
ncbi:MULTISPECIES: helix-turn-helix domain-containing protein [Clostridium]|uniref:helix-turn-helix domain-containing protein n=1 Tax=Clostridium TaxID=1485 RepID=UPI0013E954A6|nr:MULTISPECIES: helix-turn-helix transcriptional regulator [Clostridium]MBZ9633022.1 helix-turn-helix domain-containing protein [Clostridium sp. FP1]MCB2297753.1 helix-turn-helix domain-containing protein [Clostridium tagluense]